MTSLRSPGAATLGATCVLGTIIILFGHIRSIDDLTISHLYIMLALVVTLGSGHFMWDAFDGSIGGFVMGCCLLVLFLTGTVICVGLSGGRSAAIMEQKEFDAEEVKKRRVGQQNVVSTAAAEIVKAESEHVSAKARAARDKDDADGECRSGKGTKCDGMRLSSDGSKIIEEQAYARLEAAKGLHRSESAKLAAMGAPHVANAELRQIARMWAMLAKTTEDAALTAVKLTMPYLLAIVTEFGAIVFLKLAFGHAPPAKHNVRPSGALLLSGDISLSELASGCAIDVNKARRILRDKLKVPKPAQGWVFTADEARDLSSRIQAHLSQSPVAIAPQAPAVIHAPSSMPPPPTSAIIHYADKP